MYELSCYLDVLLQIRCVEEVNLRGLKEEGIYRVPGCEMITLILVLF